MEAKTNKTKNKILKKKTIKKTPRSFIAPKTNKTLDEAVPVSLLYVQNKNSNNKPRVNLSTQIPLSPFVVSFSQAQQEVEETIPNRRLNFALSEDLLTNPAPTNNQLSLAHEELTPQLTENEYTARSSQLKKPVTALPLPSLKSIQEAIQNFQHHIKISEPTVESLDWKTLELPTELAALDEILPFDLPEAEDGETEESDILTWDEVVRSADEATNQIIAEISTSETETKVTNEKKINWQEKFSTATIFAKEKTLAFKNKIATLGNRWQKATNLPLFNTMPIGWHRALAAFVLVSFAFVLPLHAMETIRNLQGAKNNLTANGLSAVGKLDTAVSSLLSTNSAAAAASFAAAQKDFSNAQITLDDLGVTTSFFLSVLPTTKEAFKSGSHLVAAGENLSEAGKQISGGLATIQDNNLDNTGKLAILSKTLETALPQIDEANKHLQKVSVDTLPTEYQKQFSDLQNSLPEFISTVKEVTEFSQTLSTLLGAEGKKRYLLLFQNNMELRPTGGFIGSFALLDINHGEISNVEIPEGGSYDLQGSMKTNYVAPMPLQLLSARWEFQDSNWFPDFPTSARQALTFYKDAGGPTVDGVVAINASLVTSLLSILGPIEMAEYDKTIDSENFLFETQKIVEYDYASYQDPNSSRKEAAPKAFIGDLASVMLNKVKDLEVQQFLKILDTTRGGLDQKDIQLYFIDEELEKTVHQLNWDGEMKDTDQDYLMVINTNLGGGKTDGVMEEKINLAVTVQEDGHIINTLTLTRNHQGIPGALFTGVNNVDYLRVYVPKGSQLISASGFSIPDTSLFEIPDDTWQTSTEISTTENTATVDSNSGTVITEENGKTSFGNWTQTKPGESSVVTFVYELPFSLKTEDKNLFQTVKEKLGLEKPASYSLLLQKQSGVVDRTTNISLSAPENWQTVWTPQDSSITFDNSSDQFFSLILKPL